MNVLRVLSLQRVVLVLALLGSCDALIERLYCGKHNCYECNETGPTHTLT